MSDGIYLLPFALAPAILCRSWPVFGEWAVPVAAVVAAGVLVVQGAGLAEGHRLHASYYPEDVACLDRATVEHGYRYGIAGYWDAKFVQGLSRAGVAPAQYAPGPVEYRWITTGDAYRADYDYAIVSLRDAPSLRISRDSIEAINGPPDVATACGDFTLLGYDGRRMRVE